MLFGQDFGGRHEGRLRARFGGNEHGGGGDNRLARPYVPL